MALELEQKYLASPETLARLARAYPGAYETIEMKTTYFDTPTGDLSRLRWTLRQRQENGASVCTLKTPAGLLARGEFEVRCPSMEKALPELAARSGKWELLELTAAGLTTVCGAAFTRRALTLDLGEATVELALDQGQLLGGGTARDFAEAEVELKDGSVEAMLAFCDALAQTFGLTQEPRSKFARARALAQEAGHGI